jgi:soluble lytic murein transglycosylase-like protein
MKAYSALNKLFMFITGIDNPVTARLSALAATAIICLGLGANGRVDAAQGSVVLHGIAHAHTVHVPVETKNIPKNLQVLSAKDAALYRAIFAAQKNDDWKTADVAIASLEDKRLMGHVLAQRYTRRPASIADYKAWLTNYADLPEAAAIYNQAQSLPGAMFAGFSKPVLAELWTGSDGYEASLGFRSGMTEADNKAAEQLADHVDHALKHGDPFAAETILDSERTRRAMPSDELSDTQSRIAASFFYEGRTEAARRLAFQAGAQNPLALWIAGLGAWKQNDAATAAVFFSRLAARDNLSGWDKAAAAFWAYRAFDKVGNAIDAHYWLRHAAQQPHSFYGLLATQLLGKTPAWSWKLPELNARNTAALAAKPAGWRAIALIQTDRSDLAEAELRRLNPHGQKDVQEAMLAVSDFAKMPSLMLRLGGLAINGQGQFYDAALYPVPPWQPEKGFQVDRALIYALMRRESRFDPTAVSEAGACGLMQLMPNTAHLISDGEIDGGKNCAQDLLDPNFNMSLGQDYVRKLASLPMVGNNLLYLLTAYNSGPGNLARWSDDAGHDPLLFIESLPVRETRDYVQQVLIQYWSYRARLGEQQVSLKQLAKGEWPRIIIDAPVTQQAALPQPLSHNAIEVASETTVH